MKETIFEVPKIQDTRPILWVKRACITVAGVYFVIGMISAYRAFYQVHSLEIQSAETVHTGAAVTVDLVSYARNRIDVRLELVQDNYSETIATYQVRSNEWAVFDPRPRHDSQNVVLGDDALKRFKTGKAILRATAFGRPQWGRTPPPKIRERVVNLERN